MQYREYDTEILNRIKDVEKQILCKYIEICEKYHLRYFVAFGTLLGTVRRKLGELEALYEEEER